MKRIVLLGATGSIGRNVLDVVERHAEEFALVGLGAHRNDGTLRGQALRHGGTLLALTEDEAAERLGRDPEVGERLVGGGPEAFGALIERAKPDLVVNAVVGFAGLRPTMAALASGIPVAIANKETVVAGGEILLSAARSGGASLIPIDSEHVAIAQCLRDERIEDVDQVIITASGGALRERAPAELAGVRVDEVLAHPTWEMGRKITVDSATLVNKGLEIIEAHWLFGLPYDKIGVVVHPQSIVHSMVRFVDGSIIAQMGEPDMRLPILYALSYPQRVASPLRHDVVEFPELTFDRVDRERYPCFGLVLEAARRGGNSPTVLSAANELAVAEFLAGRCAFPAICDAIGLALDEIPWRRIASLDDILETDAETRRWFAERHGGAGSREGAGA